MPPVMQTARVRIDHHSAVQLAAETARAVARHCGLPGAMPDQAAVVASELASNLDKHATDGSLFLQPLPLGDGMEVLAVDRGPGMPEVERCLADGYSTTGSLGAGLGAVRRIAADFTIRSEAGTGTLASARLALPGRQAGDSSGWVCLPVEGDESCGDTCALVDGANVSTAVVIDGLGHGPAAAEAGRAALHSFHSAPERPLPELLTGMNRALRHTRGAAVGVLRLGPDRADYCGVGNVRAVAVSPHGVHSLTGQPGVVGWNMPTPHIRTLKLPPGAVCALHSDGIDSRWTHQPSRFLVRLPPPLLAAALGYRHRRFRDDATALTVRPPQRHS